jgi:hypothetical protein
VILTEVFSFSAINGLAAGNMTSEAGSAVAQFNPALGTLNSFDMTTTVTATWPSGTKSEHVDGSLTVDGVQVGASASCFVSGAAPPCSPIILPIGTTGSTLNLSDFEGTGTISTSITITNEGDSSGPLDATFSHEKVSYNYTPVAVPAPLIGRGLPVLLAVGGLLFGAKLLERGKRRRLQFG